MLIELSELLPNEGKSKEIRTDIELDVFETRMGSYPFTGDKTIQLTLTNIGEKSILVEGNIACALSIPCDRCLEYVTNDFRINVSKEINMSESSVIDESREESQYIIDTSLDIDRFAYSEILVNLPMKVLCSEYCKGICNRCGANLNNGSCDCDTKELDPRMAKVLDIFNQFKEV